MAYLRVAVDLNKAEERWIQTIQQNCFSQELRVLKSVKSGYPSTHCVINQLNLDLDDKAKIRCHGRINNADVPEGSKTQLLLPAHHKFTELLIHSCVFHNGIREALNAVRENYWIIRGRKIVKKILWRCAVCKKYQGPHFSMSGSAELPLD